MVKTKLCHNFFSPALLIESVVCVLTLDVFMLAQPAVSRNHLFVFSKHFLSEVLIVLSC